MLLKLDRTAPEVNKQQVRKLQLKDAQMVKRQVMKKRFTGSSKKLGELENYSSFLRGVEELLQQHRPELHQGHGLRGEAEHEDREADINEGDTRFGG